MHNFDFPGNQTPSDPSTALKYEYQESGPMPASWYAAGGYSVDEGVLAAAHLALVDGIIIPSDYATIADAVESEFEPQHPAMEGVWKYLDVMGPLPVDSVTDPDMSASVEVLVAAGILTRTSDFYAKTDTRGYALMFPCMPTDPAPERLLGGAPFYLSDAAFTVAGLANELPSLAPRDRAVSFIRQGVLAAVLEPVVADGDVAYRVRPGVPVRIASAGINGSAGNGEVGGDMLAVALRETVAAYGALSADMLGAAHGVDLPTAPEELAELADAAGVSVELDTFIVGDKGLSLDTDTALGMAAHEVWQGMCINGPSPVAHGTGTVEAPLVTRADALAAMQGRGIVDAREGHHFLVGADGSRTYLPIRDRSVNLSPEKSEQLGAEVLAAYDRFTVADVAEMLRNANLCGEDGDEDILTAAAIVHDLGAAGRIRLDVDAAGESSAVYVAA